MAEYFPKQTYLDMIDCFKQVRKILSKDASLFDNTYICNATYKTDCDSSITALVREMVSNALGGYSTFDEWMEDHNDREFGSREIMTLRRKWIDQMVATLKNTIKEIGNDK